MLRFNIDNDFKFTLQPEVSGTLIDFTEVEDISFHIKNKITNVAFEPIWKVTTAGIDIEVQKHMVPKIGVYVGVMQYRRPDGTYSDFFQDKAIGAELFEIVSLTTPITDNGENISIPISPIYKGEAFTYDDFTDEQIADLKKPAVDAALLATESATLADEAKNFANEQGTFANEQGNYAKEQGNYAKIQGDYAKEQADFVKSLPFIESALFSEVNYEI